MPTDCTYIHTYSTVHICLPTLQHSGQPPARRTSCFYSQPVPTLFYCTAHALPACLPACSVPQVDRVCACSPADRLPLLRQLPAPSYPNYMRSSYPLGPCLSPAVATFVAATRHTHHTPTAANRASVPTLFHDPSVATLLWRQAAHPHNCPRLFQ